ncbi:amidase [Celerinatantimonas yamalensis]|uniref:Amidase n=1 Tax=Celerinatantimonas yamalensis TaxID=559956 RepID=A0ABW9GBP5_9GAMM
MADSSIYCAHGPHQLMGAASGPLQGLTFVYKDLFDVAGFRTGAGNPTWYASHAPAALTSPVLQQLLDGGATSVGRVQTDELAYSLNGCNQHFGTPENPLTPERLPGGSSSGSAVAVARGDADIGLGTDTGGSIRIPAAYNGLYGIRPTHGRLPLSGVLPLAPRFDTPGWLTRDAGVLEQVGSVLYGEPIALPMPAKLTIVASLFERLSPPLYQVWRQFLVQLEAVFDVSQLLISTAEIDDLSGVFQTLQGRQAGAIHRHWHEAHSQALAPDIDARLSWAQTLSAVQQEQSEIARRDWLTTLQALLKPAHFLVIPTTPDLAPFCQSDSRALAEFRQRLMGMTAMAGLAGCPQVHLPLLALDGAAFGFSLIGPRDSDMQLLALTRYISEVFRHG